MTAINPAVLAELRRQIEDIRTQLADDDSDETLRSDMLEGCTSIDEVLSRLVRTKVRAKAEGIGAATAKKEVGAHFDRVMSRCERADQWATDAIKAVLNSAGLNKFRVPEGAISVIPGRKSLALSDDFSPPQGYQRVRIEPDKAAISAALEAGETMPGAELVTGKPILRIV